LLRGISSCTKYLKTGQIQRTTLIYKISNSSDFEKKKKVKKVVNKIWGVVVWYLEHPSYIIEYVIVLEQTKIWGVVRPPSCTKKAI